MRLVFVLFPLAFAVPGRAATRSVTEFHAVDDEGVIDVDISIDRVTRVELTGDPDDVAKVSTTVERGVLKLATHGELHGHVHATITTPVLDAAAVSGTGSMRVTGLATTSFAAAISGAGSMRLAGTTRALEASLSGTGALDGVGLGAESATVQVSGTGTATVNATKSVVAALSGVGNVIVYGKPASVTKSITGVGHVTVKT